jgi:hypothetical protein
MPGAVVEVAGIAGSEVGTADQRAAQPEPAQSLDVVRAVGEIAVGRRLELKGTT